MQEGEGGQSVASIVLNPDKLDVEYDKENDVFYISAGKPGTCPAGQSDANLVSQLT